MEKLTWFTVLICAALVACEPRGTPQKPKTVAPLAVAAEPGFATTVPIAGDRD